MHPADLLAGVLSSLLERNGLDSEQVDDVLVGCVSQAGEQTGNIARTALLSAGFDTSVPGATVDRQCGSSQQAATFAAQGVMAGSYDIAIAAGVESMSRVPLGSAQGSQSPFGQRIAARFPDGLVNQGVSAELIAQKWGLSREQLDEFAARSHERAAAAAADGFFEDEILPVEVDGPDGARLRVDADETDSPGHHGGGARGTQARVRHGCDARALPRRRLVGDGGQLVAADRRRLGRAHHE